MYFLFGTLPFSGAAMIAVHAWKVVSFGLKTSHYYPIPNSGTALHVPELNREPRHDLVNDTAPVQPAPLHVETLMVAQLLPSADLCTQQRLNTLTNVVGYQHPNNVYPVQARFRLRKPSHSDFLPTYHSLLSPAGRTYPYRGKEHYVRAPASTSSVLTFLLRPLLIFVVKNAVTT